VTSFRDLYQLELYKLSTRGSAQAGLLFVSLMALFGIAVLLAFSMGGDSSPVAAMVDGTATQPASWALSARNFFVGKVILLLIVSQSVGGEIVDRTLRELLVRPIGRAQILGAKWAALSTWAFLLHLAPFLVAAGIGTLFWPNFEGMGQLISAYALSWLVDAVFVTLVMAISLLARTVVGTIGFTLMFLAVDLAASAGLKIALMFVRSKPELAETWEDVLYVATKCLPTEGFDVWKQLLSEQPIAWEGFAVLAVLAITGVIVSERRFASTDVA